MRSLFAKILAWFAVTLGATIVAMMLATALTYSASSSRQAPFSMLLSLELTEARNAWENGGPARLREALQRFRQVTYASDAMLTDGNGTDLLTGASRAGLLPYAKARLHSPFSIRSHVFGQTAPDGRYCLILIRDSWYFWFLQPADLLVALLVVLLCYALAHYLTKPLRQLRSAVDRLGHGDLTARAEESRKDELGEFAAAFNRMADRIQTLMAAERRLLLDISHELRSPLARLSVAVELARTSDESAPLLDRIQREADRLNSLIRQMLEVTRTEGDPARMKADHVQLDELVAALVDDCSIEAAAHGCALHLNSPSPLALDGDSELLRRAIENVMRNAIRYAPRETKIEVTVENGEGWAKIRVRDFGPEVRRGLAAAL